jgi:hypothetical protein
MDLGHLHHNGSAASASSKECLKGRMGAQETSDVDLAVKTSPFH